MNDSIGVRIAVLTLNLYMFQNTINNQSNNIMLIVKNFKTKVVFPNSIFLIAPVVLAGTDCGQVSQSVCLLSVFSI